VAGDLAGTVPGGERDDQLVALDPHPDAFAEE
jgi:hypothetical protein